MPKWSILKMDEYMRGLKDDKERTVLLACIKRKESTQVSVCRRCTDYLAFCYLPMLPRLAPT